VIVLLLFAVYAYFICVSLQRFRYPAAWYSGSVRLSL
jgi:hypothetical protein